MATVGLVLSGGGARAAYQIGVLQGLAQLGLARGGPPFAIYSGTSAGALNAAFLAGGNDRWEETLAGLAAWWSQMSVEQIYHADASTLLRSASRWAGALGQGWIRRSGAPRPPESFLDNSPLRDLLREGFSPSKVQERLDAGDLRALAVSAFSYATAKHTVFYQSANAAPPWTRKTRDARAEAITWEHLLASCALPLIFPSAQIGGERFGDGALRQLSPVSPAIHLGAERILVIETSREPNGTAEGASASNPEATPSPGQIAGHALANILSDQLAADVERVEMVNRVIEAAGLSAERQAALGLRRVELLSVCPSVKLDALASEHWADLPKPLRRALAMMGADAKRPALGSYLLFEPGYVNRLIELGREDALRQSAQLLAFFGEQPAVPQAFCESSGKPWQKKANFVRLLEDNRFFPPFSALPKPRAAPSVFSPPAPLDDAMPDSARPDAFDPSAPGSGRPILPRLPADSGEPMPHAAPSFFGEPSRLIIPRAARPSAPDGASDESIQAIETGNGPEELPFNVGEAYFPQGFLAEFRSWIAASLPVGAESDAGLPPEGALPASTFCPIATARLPKASRKAEKKAAAANPASATPEAPAFGRRFAAKFRGSLKAAPATDPLANLGAEFLPFFGWQDADAAVLPPAAKKPPLPRRLFRRGKA